MPIPNIFWAQYLENGCLITPIIDRIIRSDILARSDTSFADMFQHLDLIQYLIIAFIVILGGLFLLFKVCGGEFVEIFI